MTDDSHHEHEWRAVYRSQRWWGGETEAPSDTPVMEHQECHICLMSRDVSVTEPED